MKRTVCGREDGDEGILCVVVVGGEENGKLLDDGNHLDCTVFTY